MSDTNKWIKSARVSLDELDKLCKWYPTQRGKFLVQVDDLEKEVKRLRLVADELYLHIVGEPHMTLDELVAEMPWRNEE